MPPQNAMPPQGGMRGRMREARIDTALLDNLTISDPFIFADQASRTYYLIGTGGSGRIQARKSRDLEHWVGPFTIFQADSTLWAGPRCQVWAPEMHYYGGRYYLFATLTSNEIIEKIPGRYDIPRRAMQLLVADSPEGPFVPASPEQYTPHDWATLDGTLWVEDGVPYMVFCHEWLQIVDGTMELVRLKQDLTGTEGRPVTLFKASSSPWSREMLSIHEKTYGLDLPGNVTDGPFLFRTGTGRLGMLWSGWSDNRYCLGVSYSETGKVAGPWVHQAELIYKDNGGHAMLFNSFEGETLMVLHYSDAQHRGRTPMIMRVDLSGDRLQLKGRYAAPK
ncbi:MAG: family 43 glycosylhydrolase [Bacteroidales bacterium]|nr:family 43 glycosylhydrolase [Bacteroidales bacterium]